MLYFAVFPRSYQLYILYLDFLVDMGYHVDPMMGNRFNVNTFQRPASGSLSAYALTNFSYFQNVRFLNAAHTLNLHSISSYDYCMRTTHKLKKICVCKTITDLVKFLKLKKIVTNPKTNNNLNLINSINKIKYLEEKEDKKNANRV